MIWLILSESNNALTWFGFGKLANLTTGRINIIFFF